MNRFMTRAVRLAKLPIWYTEGFNPHPYITFAQPLSLGFASQTEILDMKMESDISNDEIKEKLLPFMPDGIEIIKVTDNVRNPKEIGFARYKIELYFNDVTKTDVEKFLSLDEIIVKKKSKKGEKDFDLKPHLKDIELSDDDNCINLILTLPSSVTISVNPTLLIKALEENLGKETDDYMITKLALFDEKGQPFLEV